MVDEYIPKLTYALKSQFIEMSCEDARALSLGGLERTTLWSRYSETEKTPIRTTQTKYGTKSLPPSERMGHYCN